MDEVVASAADAAAGTGDGASPAAGGLGPRGVPTEQIRAAAGPRLAERAAEGKSA